MDLDSRIEITRLSPRGAAFVISKLDRLCGKRSRLPTSLAADLREKNDTSRAREQESRRAERRFLAALRQILNRPTLEFEVPATSLKQRDPQPSLVLDGELTSLGRDVHEALSGLVNSGSRFLATVNGSSTTRVTVAYRNALWKPLIKPAVNSAIEDDREASINLLAAAECPVRVDSVRFDYRSIDVSVQYSDATDGLSPPFRSTALWDEYFSLYCYAPEASHRIENIQHVEQYAQVDRGPQFFEALKEYSYPSQILEPRFQFGVIQQALDMVFDHPGMTIHLSKSQLQQLRDQKLPEAEHLYVVPVASEKERDRPITRTVFLLENLDSSVSPKMRRLRNNIVEQLRCRGEEVKRWLDPR